MQTATLVMQMSSDNAMRTVMSALHAMPAVQLGVPDRTLCRQLVITIDTSDPDTIDIVREIIWEFDGLAIQHSVCLDVAS